MSQVMQAIGKYVKQKNPQPNFVVQDPDLSPEEMEGLGFKQQDEYWIISRQDAMAIFEPREFDFDAHWKAEQKMRRDAIPK